jgi:hypothetical protein
VVAFDMRDRDSLLRDLDTWSMRLLNRGVDLYRWLRSLRELNFLEDAGFWQFALRVIIFLIIFGTAAIFAMVAYFLFQRSLLRQRAARIGLERLPVPLQIRYARQLAFYDALAGLLARLKVRRPEHLTPREWAASLVFLPGAAYRDVARLTEILYKVRFGKAELSPARQRHLLAAVERLRPRLGD